MKKKKKKYKNFSKNKFMIRLQQNVLIKMFLKNGQKKRDIIE